MEASAEVPSSAAQLSAAETLTLANNPKQNIGSIRYDFGMANAETLSLDVVSRENQVRLATASAVSRSAFKVLTGGMFSLAAGLASQVIVAALFGAGWAMDAFLTALVVPTYLSYVLISGLSFVLIPAFVQEETTGSADDAWALVGTFFWIITAVLVVVALVGSILAEQIIATTAPGFGPEKSALASRMLSTMMLTVPFIGVGSLTGGIQNARNRFFWPAAAQGIGSLGNVGTLLILYPTAGPMALAWGNLTAAVLSAAVSTLPVLRHGWRKLLPVNDTRVLRLGALILPFIVFGLVTQSVSIFERYFASDLPDGDLSCLGYAGKISSVSVALLAGSIASAIFPTMAREYARRGQKGLVEQTEFGFQLTFATALPALAVTGAVALPLVMVMFERGAFSHAASIQVARVVAFVMLGDLLFRMMGNITGRTLYVVHDTLTFPLLSALAVALYIPMAKALAGVWGFVGLALARPFEMGLLNLIVIFIMARKVRPFNPVKVSKAFSLYLIASLAAALCAWLVTVVLGALTVWLQLMAGFVIAGIVYMCIMLWVDRDTAISILEMVGLKQILQAFQAKFWSHASN